MKDIANETASVEFNWYQLDFTYKKCLERK